MQKNSNTRDTISVGLRKEVDNLSIVAAILLVICLTILYFWLPDLVSDTGMCLGKLQIFCSDLRDFGQEIAAGVISVGLAYVVGFLILRHFRNAKDEQKNRDLASSVVTEIEPVLAYYTGIQKKFIEYGISNCYRSLDEVKEKVKRDLPCREIRIMTTWFTNTDALREIFIKAAKRKGYRIRILLLDPDSKAAEQRSQDLKEFDVGDVRARIRECRRDLEGLNLGGMELRYYNLLPSFPLYAFDNHAFFGVFPHIFLADFGPWLEIQLRNSDKDYTNIGNFLNEEFDKVWKEAFDVKLLDRQH